MRNSLLNRHYDKFTPHERLRLVLEAQGRGDAAEAHRLRDTCPRRVYRTADYAFEGADDSVLWNTCRSRGGHWIV